MSVPARLFEVPESQKVVNGLFTSLTPEWPTPQALFDQLDREFAFTLDPCSTHENAKCEKHYTSEENGLSKSWAGERVFMNPPYGDELPKWIQKASESETLVVALIPSRTDTRWWHDYVMEADEVRFIKGRVKFGDAQSGAPFPSAVVVWNPPVEAPGPGTALRPATAMRLIQAARAEKRQACLSVRMNGTTFYETEEGARRFIRAARLRVEESLRKEQE